MYVAPKSVSQRVVNTLMISPVVALKSTSAPVERPIPVALLYLYALDIVHVVQVVYESLGIGGDPEHPLALFLGG